MLLFKPTHVDSILGRTPYLKTETRRRGGNYWKPNSIHLCKTNYSASSAFARIRILSVHQEPLFNITLESAYNEGYAAGADIRSTRLPGDPLRQLQIFLGVNLRHIGTGVPQSDLGGFDAVFLPYLRATAMS